MGGYDQFISLLFYVLQIIYVSYIHLCCFICSNDFILSVMSYYNMIYLSVLNLQSCCLCLYLFIFNCSVSLYVYRIYMIYMIHILCVLMIHIVMDIFEITISMINYLLYVIIIKLIYRIKMIRKISIFLTLQGKQLCLHMPIGVTSTGTQPKPSVWQTRSISRSCISRCKHCILVSVSVFDNKIEILNISF
jgi:hypothetical protein